MALFPDSFVRNLQYCFYNPEEVETLSVCKIQNEMTFDKLTGRGVDGGLHDVSMGLCTEKDLCGHCGLSFLLCPGHFGFIEFAKPVYNPLFFDLLCKLLKSFCFSCFRLYNVECLPAILFHLGAPSHTLPGVPKKHDLKELEGYTKRQLRQLAIRTLSSRPRVPCKLCCSKAWIMRHINKQQLLARPVSETARSRSLKSELNASEGDESIDDIIELAENKDPRLTSSIECGSMFFDPAAPDSNPDIEKTRSELFAVTRDELAEASKLCRNTKDACLLPETVRNLLRCLWVNDGGLLCLLLPMLAAASKRYQFGTDIFFMNGVLISPSICRLPRYVAGLSFEHPETAVYSRVVRRAQCLSHIVDFIEQQNADPASLENSISQLSSREEDPDPKQIALQQMTTTRSEGALKLACIMLQAAVNGLYDANTAIVPAGLDSKVGNSVSSIRLPGLRQRLEKKEGLFRMHIMGKRVNYACRSVISPDPNLDVTEVGVPLFFASRLTFPTHVNTYNITDLRQLVLNGPDKYPGARSVQTPDGQLVHLPRGDNANAKRKRAAMARRLAVVSPDSGDVPFVVNRHLQEGDLLVMNRQPTLHKNSMQAHRVRIIHSAGAKTLRMHYSNCKAYNADFDGDEMNGHLVQSCAAQVELENLAYVPYQYLGPKDGTPLAGLIQDYVIAAVKLTVRDRFFNEDDYLDLVYHALRSVFAASRHEPTGPPSLTILPPAILRPERLWTGKQIISTLLINLTPPGLPRLNCALRGRRTKAELWAGVAPGQSTLMSDVDLFVCDGYLASGLLDKAHIGSSEGGLVHCVHETYGPKAAAHLLNGISLLANRLLKYTAFTMGIGDVLLSAHADQERCRRFSNLRDLGLCAFADAFGLDPDCLSESEVRRLYRQAHFAPSTDQTLRKRMIQLDNAMKGRLKKAQDAVCDAAIPSGLYIGFPENNLQLMVHVGAKGGMVNAQQMSVALGQIELEGRRVPLMLSGRSLPSFPPYDVRPRAGGMCTHRFLTSLPPQELFFHSMAGRDGLVDTAVKTSRSGYLQRSAIKHLEDVTIQYDGTVRDSGQNIVQFRYGDDGVDVSQASFLQPSGFHLFADNATLLITRWCSLSTSEQVEAYQRLLRANQLPKPLQVIADQVGTQRQMLLLKTPSSSKLRKLLRKAKEAEELLSQNNAVDKQMSAPERLTSDLPPPPCEMAAALRELCVAKLISAQSPPGEPVGILAAQSVGEPSTQMTLNTFHFAGRGEMNVTLGIPRLREILMSGTAKLNTPCMEVPVRPTNEARRCCNRIAKRFYKLKLTEAIKLPLGEKVDYASDSYTLEFHLEPASAYKMRSHVRPARVLRFLERVLFPDLAKRLDRELRDQGKTTLIRSFALSAFARHQQQAGGGANDPDDVDDTVAEAKHRKDDDEWNEDDGHEATRRRRLEAENDAVGRDNVVDSEDIVDLDVDDDDEAAELRELAVKAGKIRNEDDDEDEDEEEVERVGNSNLAKHPRGTSAPTVTVTENRLDLAELSGLTEEFDNPDQDADEEELHSDAEACDQSEKQDKSDEFEVESRRTFVTRLHARFSDYQFDRSNPPTWARLTICMFDPKEGRISVDLKTIVMRIVNKSVVSSVPGIEKVIVDRSNANEWMFRVEGINMIEMMRYPGVFDLNRLYTNNIGIICQTYGIEAARAAIVKEVSSVFGHYGIHVNSRHLCLIADYMTKSGAYRAFNRNAFVGHPSPVQQMSFETVIHAIKETIQDDRMDNILSPSASLLVSRIVHNSGTNCFDLLQALPV